MTLLNNVLETLGATLKTGLVNDINDKKFDTDNLKDVLKVLFYNETITDREKEVIDGIISYQDVTNTEEQIEVIEEVVNNFDESEDSQYIECVGFEVRVITNETIEEIWEEELEETIKECYDLTNVPNFVEIDWKKTVENCKVDGMGHHFSGYDFSEDETENYHYFRTN